jgi:hypothetical protein
MVVLAGTGASRERKQEDDRRPTHHDPTYHVQRLAMGGSFLLSFALGIGSLDRVRSDPALANDPRAIDELVREADAAPPSAERADAWALAAEAYAHRLGRPADAERLDRKIKDDDAADPVARRKARSDLVALLLARRAFAEADDVARGEESLEKLARSAWRTHRLSRASLATLATLAVLTLVGLVRGARARVAPAMKRLAPYALAYAAYLGLGGALLASRYESGNARPFLFFGAALVPLLFLSRAWAAAGATTTAARVGRAAVCAAGVASAAFLAYVEGTKP